MKTFIKDYLNLCKKSGEFYKNHWKGVIVLNAIITTGGFLYILRDDIKYYLEEKFVKKR